MPVDKTLPVHVSWSLGGLTVCSQGFLPMSELARTMWLGVGREGPVSALHGALRMLALPELCGCSVELFWKRVLEVGASSHLHLALSPRAVFFFFLFLTQCVSEDFW